MTGAPGRTAKNSSLQRGIEAGIFGAGAIILGGIGIALTAEAVAIWTGEVTISEITANAVRKNPSLTSTIIFGIGGLAGALIAHFTDWEP